MRKTLRYGLVFALSLFLGACEDFLSLEPLDKVPAEVVFNSEAGVLTALANLYNKMPMEDFNWRPGNGFNQRPTVGGSGDGGAMSAGMTDEAEIHSNAQGGAIPGGTIHGYWEYGNIRQINLFLESILKLRNTGGLTEELYSTLKGEALFIRGYVYFQMVRRYGGVPIVKEVQKLNPDGTIEHLKIPRNTEKETWDFVLSDLDSAIINLPEVNTGGKYRVNKYIALALQSRAALHAASVAKYWNEAPLTHQSVDLGLVGGMTITDANEYYLKCIEASSAIIGSGRYSIFMPNPANPAEAAVNYQTMFESPDFVNNKEIIYMRAYLDGQGYGQQQGHITDFMLYPHQVSFNPTYHYSRFGATLDMVDLYEDYTDDGTRGDSPLKTRVDGNETVHASQVGSILALPAPHILYDNQYQIFENKDARLRASIILPGSTFSGAVMNMQGGYILPDGKPVIYSKSSTTVNGITYHTYGVASSAAYSAFADMGTNNANYSSTGFALRKFLQDTKKVTNLGPYGSTQGWIDFRLAEIYLNYAEAAIESGQGDAALAAQYLNAIRQRAAHTDQIQATVENIVKERTVEFMFEGQHYWDLIRRREYHKKFRAYNRKSLIPLQDLRQDPPKYVFLRAENFYDEQVRGRTFDATDYYISIPGLSSNPNLIQNPGY